MARKIDIIKNQARQYAASLWQGANTDLCNVVAGGHYHIGIVTDGAVQRQLTPCYKTVPELLAYLQGLHAAKYQQANKLSPTRRKPLKRNKTMKITSFRQIDILYHNKGVNICKGCEREYYASCYSHCCGNQFADCNKQARMYASEINKLN